MTVLCEPGRSEVTPKGPPVSTHSPHDPMPEQSPAAPLAEELVEYLEDVEEHIEEKLGPLASCRAAEEPERGPQAAPEGASD